MTEGERSQRAAARFAGLMLLVVLAASFVGLVLSTEIAGSGTADEQTQRIIASEGLYRLALVSGLCGSLFTVLLGWSLYVTVRPADRNLAVLGLLFRTGESVIGAVGIIIAFAALEIRLTVRDPTAFAADELASIASLISSAPTAEIAAIFFSFGSAIFFYVLLRSSLIPKALSLLGLIASATYAALWLARLLVPESSGLAIVGSIPILLAELSTGVWLLTKGVTMPTAGRSAR